MLGVHQLGLSHEVFRQKVVCVSHVVCCSCCHLVLFSVLSYSSLMPKYCLKYYINKKIVFDMNLYQAQIVVG